MLITTLQTSMANKYSEVKYLLEKQSKLDPPSEPHKSEYRAIEILKDMKSMLTCKMNMYNSENENEELSEIKLMLAVVYFTLGKSHYNSENLVSAEKYFKKCLDTVSKENLHPDTILMILSGLNELGVIWFQRNDPQKAREHLESAEKLFNEYVTIYPTEVPVIDWIFHTSTTEEIGERPLESTYALSTFYLAQVYKSMDFHLRAVLYCHMTLKKQLEFEDLDKLDWATNAATLSQFFLEINCFKEARHHLAAASTLLRQHESQLQFETCPEDEMEAKMELLNRRAADVARCWTKYGLLLMSISKRRLISDDDNRFHKSLEMQVILKESEVLKKENLKFSDLQNFTFEDLDTAYYENKISFNYLLTFEDARQVFLYIQQHLITAKKYYTLDTHASDMIQITQDHSQLYRHLCFFEEEDPRKCGMLKRRLALLDPLQSQVNPKYYIDSCRELWYEMAQINSDLLDIKLNIMQDKPENSKASINKANAICDNSVKFFEKFLDSFKDKDGNMPEKFEEDITRPVLNAYFTIARVYQKRICSSNDDVVENNKHCLKYYTNFIKYCDKHEETKKQMKTEYNLCLDMKRLLPLKMDKIAKDIFTK